MIRSIHHVTLPIPPGGEAEGLAFYVDLLGLERIPKPEPMGVTGAWLRFPDGRHIHLQADPAWKPIDPPHPALVTDDLAGLVSRLEDAGFRFEYDDLWPGVRRGFTWDPFGNRLELMDATDLQGVFGFQP